ncbi:MAG: DNA topoisomerase I [Crocinitomicaceae bacterium]|nr:DNA topoisomerase I [Crocinitomicaceae bacterium]|tara:strand:+ start:8199 stop:10502 length:2304 start_codon:yes stop_codon:yes gene_type:complete
MNLVIVESPAKAKTIENFLGKDYVVKSSFGHVRDLAKKNFGIDVENNFEPTYDVLADKKSVIKDLKSLAKKSDMVWLATDEDREGEAISWHLFETLGLKKDSTQRIVFHEITKSAILKAIDAPRKIDQNLVDAQQARRVLDRLVGFELSPVLWKKVKPSLSAGRVQSVTVRLIVEREREIEKFVPTSSFKVSAEFLVDSKSVLKAELPKRLKSEEEANTFLNSCKGATYEIEKKDVKPLKRNPAPPFTTSTLQQEASRKLGFSVQQTMVVAQKLYEAGRITYMRTDSVNLSDLAINEARNEIHAAYGEKYAFERHYATKTKGAQEAHEAIRPTNFAAHSVSADRNEERLYSLIWQRAIASQMASAEIEKTTVTIGISGSEEKLRATGEVLTFDGFIKVYTEGNDDEGEDDKSGMLPPIKVGDQLQLESLKAVERFANHPPRYTEASLVKQLETLGIGRPSTYAPTISTVQKRGYIEKKEKEGTERNYAVLELVNGDVSKSIKTEITGAEKKKLFPSDIGIVVTDFLMDHFPNVMDYGFTAEAEKEFDSIAQGQKQWNEMIGRFYGPFKENIEVTLKEEGRATGERLLGVDPKSGRNIYARIGRFGPMVQIGNVEDEEKPKFAKITGDSSITSITLEEALELFKMPKDLGEFEDKKVVVGIGRFGPYVRHNSKFVSLGKTDPHSVNLEQAIELILAKREADANKIIREFEENADVSVLNGRWGPYIKVGKQNVKIPKDVDPTSLTLEDCLKLAKNAPAKRKFSKKKSK